MVLAGLKRQAGDTFESFEQNMQIATTLARAIEKARPKQVIFFSSAAVYGEETHDLAISELTPVNPVSCYGIAKFASERVISIAAENVGSYLAVLRPPVIYGPGDSTNSYGPVAFCRAARRGDPVTLWGDGSELREFVFVEDCARMVGDLLDFEWLGVLNMASGNSHTFRDVVAAVGCSSGRVLEVGEKPRTKMKADNVFDPSLLNSLLPNFSWTSLQDGVQLTLNKPEA